MEKQEPHENAHRHRSADWIGCVRPQEDKCMVDEKETFYNQPESLLFSAGGIKEDDPTATNPNEDMTNDNSMIIHNIN